MGIAAGLRVHPASRSRGVAEASTTAADSKRPRITRHVAGVIADAVVLFVGDLVLLVDDDQAEIAERQEQAGACPRHDLDGAGRDPDPGAGAAARRDPGMPFGRGRSEARCEPPEEFGRQRDLGQEDQHLPA